MKKVVIFGETYVLKNPEEVSYGAGKKLERARFAAQMAMLSDSDVIALAKKTKGETGEVNEEEFMDHVLSGATKQAILDSHEAAISPMEEAIILSADIDRDKLLKMPAKVVEELGALALKELGAVEDFSEASSTDTK